MMRLGVMGLVAFVLSLGGTTGALVWRARTALPGDADSVAVQTDVAKVPADSAQPHLPAGTTHADTLAPHSDSTRQPAAGSTVRVDSNTPSNAATSALGATPAAGSTAAPPAASPRAVAPGHVDVAYRQLARIFSNMKTIDAAKVLAYMSDEEVQGVLQQVGVRPAARLLAALPKERAAVLSRRMLVASEERGVTP